MAAKYGSMFYKNQEFTDLVSRIRLDEVPGRRNLPKDTSMQIKRLTREIQCEFTPIRECVKQIACSYGK